jgi:hypothetical protein
MPEPDQYDESDDSHARIRHVFTNVIETIFSPLASDSKARKKEQDCRRKFKEKVIAKYPEHLIVDSIGHTISGKEEVQYTNTILVTETLDWWRNNVVKLYKDNYIQEQKDLRCGNQLTWRDKNGEK